MWVPTRPNFTCAATLPRTILADRLGTGIVRQVAADTHLVSFIERDKSLENHGREIESRTNWFARNAAFGLAQGCACAKTEDQAGAATETQERDSPLLDLSDQAVKRLLKTAKARGYVTSTS